MKLIYLAHVRAWNPVTSSEVTFYFSSQGFVTGSANLPPGGVAHTAYENRIQQPALIRRSCWKDGAIGGDIEVGFGAIVCVNIDGGLDHLIDYVFDGRDITLILGTIKPDSGSVPTWTIVFEGKMAEPELTSKYFNIYLRDMMIELDKPICTNKYLGDNVAPDGTEGTAADLIDQQKPVALGKPKNVPGVCVNEIKSIYQFNDGVLTGFAGVYDKANPLVQQLPPYNDVNDMLANAPDEGKYRALLSGGYIRTGAKPKGLITADLIEGAAPGDRTCASVIYRILKIAGIPDANISLSDLATLNAQQPAEIGLHFRDETTCRQALSKAAASAGAWCGFNRQRIFRVKRFDAPTNTPVLTLTQSDIFEVEHINLDRIGVPVWKLLLKYARNTVVQTSDFAEAVSATRREELSKEFKQIERFADAIKNQYPLAREVSFETDIVGRVEANAEALRRFNIFNKRRHAYRVAAYIRPELIPIIDLGIEVRIVFDRFLLNGGKEFIVLGLQENHYKNRVELTIFG